MELKRIFQANEITKGRYHFSALAKDAFLMVLQQLKKNDPIDKAYVVSVKDWQDKKGVKLSFGRVEQAFDELRNTDIVIERKIGDEVNGNKIKKDGILKSKFVSSVEYIKGTGIAEVTIDSKIREYYFDLKKNFAVFQFKMALSLNSFYSKRIYELLSMDKRKTQFVIEIAELRDMFGLNDITANGKIRLKTYYDFNKIVLVQAQKELNEHTDVTFDYEALSLLGGKRKSHIRFYNITYKNPYQTSIDFIGEELEIYTRLMDEFKLTKLQASEIMTTFSVVNIRKEFNYIKTNFDSNKGTIGGFAAKQFGVQN